MGAFIPKEGRRASRCQDVSINPNAATSGLPLCLSAGASNADDIIGRIYAGTGANRLEILNIQAAVQKGDKAGALNDLRRLRATLAPGDPQIAFFDRRIGELQADLQFTAGDWSAMLRSRSLFDWEQPEGDWSLDARGRVLGSGHDNFKSLFWHDRELGLDIGGTFEASVRVYRPNHKASRIDVLFENPRIRKPLAAAGG